VSVVRSAATSQYRQIREGRSKLRILGTELARIAIVELVSLVPARDLGKIVARTGLTSGAGRRVQGVDAAVHRGLGYSFDRQLETSGQVDTG
jgi:hypothetical protein